MKRIKVILDSLFVTWLSVLLTLGADIRFQVIDSRSGLPVEKVAVEVGIPNDAPIKGATSPTGNFHSRGTLRPGQRASILIRKQGYAPLQFHYDPAGNGFAIGESGLVKIFQSKTIGGRVVDTDETPLEGAQVIIRFAQSLGGPRVPHSELTTHTDADGKWSLSSIPDHVELLRAEIELADFEQIETDSSAFPMSSLEQFSTVTHMKPWYVVQGIVVDPSGAPVEGAEVTIGSQHGIMGMGQDPSVSTDQEGRFTFSQVDPGMKTIGASSLEWAPVVTSITVGKKASDLRLQLSKPTTVTFTVMDSAQKPLKGVRISISEWKRFSYPGWEVTTDTQGIASWENAPAGDLRLNITKGGYMSSIHVPISNPPEKQQFILVPELHVQGTVVDAESKLPISEFALICGTPRQTVGPNGKQTTSGAHWPGHQSKQFKNGKFDVTYDSPAIVGTKEPFDFIFRIDAEGYETAVSEIVKADAGSAQLKFELKKGGEISGRVMPLGKRLLSDARVYVSERMFGLNIINGSIDTRFRDVQMIPIQSDGSFTMREPPGTASMAVLSDHGYALFDSDQLKVNPNIELKAWGSIKGTYKIGNQPGANATLALWFGDIYSDQGRGIRVNRTPFQRYTTDCDAMGRFQFEKVPATTLSIARVVQKERPRGATTTNNEIWGAQRLHTLHVRPGDELEVEIGGAGTSVSGVLVVPQEVRDKADLQKSSYFLTPTNLVFPEPTGETREEKQAWLEKWFWSEETSPIRHWFGSVPFVSTNDRISGLYPQGWRVFPDENGHFNVSDVPIGDYILRANYQAASDSNQHFGGIPLGRSEYVFSVGADSGTTKDLGSIVVPLVPFDAQTGSGHIPEGILQAMRAKQKVSPTSSLEPKAPSTENKVTALLAMNSSESDENTYTLVVKLRIMEGCHIYAMDATGGANIPTSFQLELPEGFELSDSWKGSVTSEKSGAKIYQSKAQFSCNLRRTSQKTANPETVKCKVTYQLCNESVCWPPAKLELETDFPH